MVQARTLLLSTSSVTGQSIALGVPYIRPAQSLIKRICFVENTSLRLIDLLPKQNRRKRLRKVCRSELLHDAPIALAIGACVASSLVLGKPNNEHSKQGQLTENDVRNGAMTIISFIPLFNWLAWVFSYLDTNEGRYLVYAAVYLIPYLRNGFSLAADDEHFVLYLSFFACIAHVQIDINVDAYGDDQGKSIQDALQEFSKKLFQRGLRGPTNKFPVSENKDAVTNVDAEEEYRQREFRNFDRELSERSKEKNEELENSENTNSSMKD